jgi:hypothetical protein
VPSALHVGAHVIAGADDVIDPLLVHVGFLALEAQLIAALEEHAVAVEHLIVGVGRGVVKVFGEILDQNFGAGS